MNSKTSSGLIIVAFAGLATFGCREESSPSAARAAATEDLKQMPIETAPIYNEMRNAVLTLDRAVLNLPEDSSEPIALVMDLGENDYVVTLVAVADGSTSMYFSNGGGIIGAGEHDPVRHAADVWLRMGLQYRQLMSPVKEFPLPPSGSVRFYMVLDGEVRSAISTDAALTNVNHPLHELFRTGHDVITAVRIADTEYTRENPESGG